MTTSKISLRAKQKTARARVALQRVWQFLASFSTPRTFTQRQDTPSSDGAARQSAALPGTKISFAYIYASGNRSDDQSCGKYNRNCALCLISDPHLFPRVLCAIIFCVPHRRRAWRVALTVDGTESTIAKQVRVTLAGA